MATETEHGSWSGVVAHTKQREHFCLPCAAFEVDRGRAYRVRTGRTKRLQITTSVLAAILAGDDPEQALVGEIGPLTFEALRGMKAASQHG